jgi:hypothetical protein
MTEHVGAQADGGDLPVGGFFQTLGQLPAGGAVAKRHQVQRAGAAAGFFRCGNKDFARQRAGAALGFEVVDEVHGYGHYNHCNVLSIQEKEFTDSVMARTITVMDSRTARTLNIRDLVEKVGGPTRFANLYGHGAWTQAQVSQWVSIKKPVGIGHSLARRLEDAIGLANGAMDHHPMALDQPSAKNRVEEPSASYNAVDPDETVLLELFRRLPQRKKRAILDLMHSESPPAEK